MRLARALAPTLSRLPVGCHAGSITAKSAKIAGRLQPAAGAASTASVAVGIKFSPRGGVRVTDAGGQGAELRSCGDLVAVAAE